MHSPSTSYTINASLPLDVDSPPNPTDTDPASLQSLNTLHILPPLARRNRPPQRRLDISPYKPVSLSLSRCSALSQIRDEAFCQADGNVEALAFV
jgi:hypothetical protein